MMMAEFSFNCNPFGIQHAGNCYQYVFTFIPLPYRDCMLWGKPIPGILLFFMGSTLWFFYFFVWNNFLFAAKRSGFSQLSENSNHYYGKENTRHTLNFLPSHFFFYHITSHVLLYLFTFLFLSIPLYILDCTFIIALNYGKVWIFWIRNHCPRKKNIVSYLKRSVNLHGKTQYPECTIIITAILLFFVYW